MEERTEYSRSEGFAQKNPESHAREITTRGRLGLMGGTFDPIHNGHLALAEAARTALSLDSVLFMPAGCSYLKAGRKIAAREDRCRMTALAIAGHPHFSLSRMEIDRPGNTYTADTLRALCAQYPGDEWFLLLGADAFLMIDRWVRPEEIFARSTLVCMARGADGRERLEEKRAALAEHFGARSVLLDAGRVDISSSDIRARIAAGQSVQGLVPDAVLDDIRARGLYQGKETAAAPGDTFA